LVGDFGEVDFADVVTVCEVLREGIFPEPTVGQIVTFASDKVVLLEEHFCGLLLILTLYYIPIHFLLLINHHSII
jgi:hypothetical protein